MSTPSSNERVDRLVRIDFLVTQINALRKELDIKWFVCVVCKDVITGFSGNKLESNRWGDRKLYCDDCKAYCAECEVDYAPVMAYRHENCAKPDNESDMQYEEQKATKYDRCMDCGRMHAPHKECYE
jgi:hypothetical protein